MGLGVFTGILPGTGPLAALFLAFIFRANRASALLGSIATNTWFSFFTLVLAFKIGFVLIKPASLKTTILRTILPPLAGYLVIALCAGLLTYLITLILVVIAKGRRKRDGKQAD
jgi:uncharacterized protein (DUF2062 family)